MLLKAESEQGNPGNPPSATTAWRKKTITIIQSVDRAIDLLEALSHSRTTPTLMDLASARA